MVRLKEGQMQWASGGTRAVLSGRYCNRYARPFMTSVVLQDEILRCVDALQLSAKYSVA